MSESSSKTTTTTTTITTKTTINDLPPDLLIKILTFLPTIESIRSTSISPKFLNLWHQIPSLNFDMSLYHSPPKTLSSSRKNFSNIITQTLNLRPISTPLRSFRLVYNYLPYSRTKQQLDSWIRQAVSSRVEILRLSFEDEHFVVSANDIDKHCFEMYDFHFSHLNNTTCFVWLLDLCHVRVVWPKMVSVDNFNSITSVYLHDVRVKENVLSEMVSACVNLEYLCLSCLSGLRNFRIKSESLEELVLGYFHPGLGERAVGCLDVCAPNLSSIVFECFCVRKYRGSDLSSLVEVDVDFADAHEDDHVYCWGVLELLSGVEGIDDLTLNLNQDILYEIVDLIGISNAIHRRVLVNLKYLELRTEYTESDLNRIGKFLKLCPHLETMLLVSIDNKDGTWSKEFKSKPLILEIPSLKQVELKNYNGSENELYFVEVLKTHKVALQKIVAFPREVDGLIPPPIVFLDA